MKTDKKITVSLTERNYQKVVELAKENNVSFKLALNSLIGKGLTKKNNDYAELINFFKDNFIDKKAKEIFEMYSRIEKQKASIDDLNNNFNELIKILTTPVKEEPKKLTAEYMFKSEKLSKDEMKKLDDEFWSKK